MQKREPSTYANLKGFVSFLSFSGSGHSLVSSLLDAHKNITISREQLILQRLYKEELSRTKAFHHIVSASSNYTLKGRPHKGSNTSHLVPNQFNGNSRHIKFLGDKNGYGTVSGITCKVNFLEDLDRIIKLPLYFIHVYRNPYHSIAHSFRCYPRLDIHTSANRLISKYLQTDIAINNVLEFGYPLISVKYESLVLDPPSILTNLLSFFSLTPTKSYLSSCSSIIDSSFLQEYSGRDWSPKIISDVTKLCNYLPYLQGYEP